MPEINLPMPTTGGSTEDKINNLTDVVMRLRKELDYLLQNLDEKNVIRAGSIYAENIDVTNAKIAAAQIVTLEVGNNVTMGEDAYISWENVTNQPTIPTQYTDTMALNKINATYIDGNGVWTPSVYAQNINTSVAKIGTAQIVDLVVGGNVSMGSNATISWSKVTDHPTIPEVPGYITSTKITSTTIESPTITGGTITGGTIKSLDANSHKQGIYIEGSTGDIKFYYNDTELVNFYNAQDGYVLRAKTGYYFQIGSPATGYTGTIYFGGTIDFSSATCSGITAKFA